MEVPIMTYRPLIRDGLICLDGEPVGMSMVPYVISPGVLVETLRIIMFTGVLHAICLTNQAKLIGAIMPYQMEVSRNTLGEHCQKMNGNMSLNNETPLLEHGMRKLK